MPYPPGTLFTPRFDRYFRTHEKVMWQFSAINFDEIQRHLITDADIEAVWAAMLVESHNPVFTQYLLEYFRHDHEMAAFIVTWSYEEMKHYGILRTYLEATGLVNVAELEQELLVTRAGPWGDVEKLFTPVQSYAYTMLQEQVTGLFYKRFAQTANEPVLKHILQLVGKDEYRHSQWYLEKGKEALAQSKGRLEEIDDVLLRFQMPGPSFMQNYEKHGQAMLKVANLDVLAMKETIDKIGQLTGRFHLLKLATNGAYLNKLRDEWGLHPKMVLDMLH